MFPQRDDGFRPVFLYIVIHIYYRLTVVVRLHCGWSSVAGVQGWARARSALKGIRYSRARARALKGKGKQGTHALALKGMNVKCPCPEGISRSFTRYFKVFFKVFQGLFQGILRSFSRFSRFFSRYFKVFSRSFKVIQRLFKCLSCMNEKSFSRTFLLSM
jgi:hypothetical protein